MTPAPLILVIEDDHHITDLIKRSLIYDGYRTQVAYDGSEGLRLARDMPPDLVVLDLMLPGIDGLEVCKRLRAVSDVPIIILTARDAIADRITGLDSGADDYIVKPFDPDELLARIRALLRRVKQRRNPTVYRYADLELNTGTHDVKRGNRKIQLTAKEFDILTLFMTNPKQVLTRDIIYDRIWGYDFGAESNLIEVYIRYLRNKLEENGEQRLIHTIRGVGYILRT